MKKITIVLLVLMIFSCKPNEEVFIPLSQLFNKKSIKFMVDTVKDTIIEGDKGTLIFIEKESFEDSKGNAVTGCVEIGLKEIYSIEETIFQNISTISDKGILETGGMVKLSAISKGDVLRLKNNKKLIVHFPKRGKKKDMSLYYGDVDTSGIIAWKKDENSSYRLENKIHVWYRKYEYLDDSTLYLSDGRNAFDTIKTHFNFNKKEIEYLVNKTIDAKYTVYENGKLVYERITGSKINNALRRKIKKKVKSFPLCLPYKREGDPIDMPGFFKIWTEVIKPDYLSNENYLKSIEKRLSRKGNQKPIDVAELQYYIFDSRKLDWMNCDMFIDFAEKEKVNFEVKVPKSKDIFVKLIFRNYKTVMTGNEKKDKFVFENLPVGEPIKIVVLDDKKGKPFLEIIDTIVQRAPVESLNLMEVSLAELQSKLKELD